MGTITTKRSIFHLSEKTKEMTFNLVSLVFVCLFIYTAVSKFITHDKFVWALGMSPYVGNKAELLGWVIPILELLVSGLLILEKFRRKGLAASLILMILFTVYLIIMVTTVGKLPCTCGGVISEMSWNQHIVLNVFLIGLSAIGLLAHKK